MLARIAPAGLVVAVASTARSSRPASSNPPDAVVRASTTAACDTAGRVLCALITIASAPAARACGGSAGCRPKWAPHAASTTSGTPAACAAAARPRTSPVVPTYEGSPTTTATAPGCRVSASSTASTGTAPGSPRAASTAGRSHTGRRPASTSPRSTERCSVRPTTTSSPGRPTASARVWLPWVEPPTENRHQSAPQNTAARRSASASTPRACFMVSSPAKSGTSPATTLPTRSVRCLWPGMVKGRTAPVPALPVKDSQASSRGASARRPSGSRGSAVSTGLTAPGRGSPRRPYRQAACPG